MFIRMAVVRMSVHLSCMAKAVNVRHYTQTFQPKFFIPVMPIGTLDLCHFIPLSVILTLAVGHKVQHIFQMIRVKVDLAFEILKLNSLILLLSQIYVIKVNNCCFIDCVKQI